MCAENVEERVDDPIGYRTVRAAKPVEDGDGGTLRFTAAMSATPRRIP